MSTATAEEKKLYHVMGKLKASNTHRAMLHEQINASIDLIEAMIIATPESDALKTLLLKTLETHRRDKTVAKYKIDGLEYTSESSIRATDDWMVSVVRGGSKVRVSITPKKAAALRAELERMGATTIVLYE